jgi:N-acetylneuraminate synthase
LSQHELFKKYDSFGEKEYKNLADHCREIDIDFVSTPFDDAAIEFLDPLVPFFKIASADITNIPLLRKVAGKGKPVVLSTGASTLAEVDMALEALSHSGCSEVGLLHCVLNYPTAYENAHVGMISGLERAYPELVIGYSDHTLPDDTMFVLTLAYLKGARIIEKHFTDDKRLPGNDHYHAMDVNDLRVFRQNIDKIRTVTGSDHKHPLPSEAQSRLHARRSIVLKKDVLRGTALTESMIICKRPSHGISPVHWDAVLGRKAARDLKEDSVLQWEDLTR